MNNYFFPYYFYPNILYLVTYPHMNEKPPTVYSLLESIVNYGKDNKTKIKDLAKNGRTTFFDFDYELSENITKEKFETTILNHFLMRRIGFDTLTAFKIQLNVKLNEIMPLYNKMFDALENWNIFNDGEVTTKTGNIEDNNTINNTASNTLNNTANNTTNNISDRRESDTPQNQLQDIRDGNYVTKYNYDTSNTTSQDTSNATGNSTSNTTEEKQNQYQETITKSPADKIAILKEMQENINNIFTLIFSDLECLFYQLV